MGRYASDVYYSGGAYYFATLAAAEFYFKLAHALRSGARSRRDGGRTRAFAERLCAGGRKRPPQPPRSARGDAIMRTVRAFTPASGELSEQFDRTTGAQTSAKHLAWSYAAFITAAASRRRALRGQCELEALLRDPRGRASTIRLPKRRRRPKAWRISILM